MSQDLGHNIFVYSAGDTAAVHFQRTIVDGVPLSSLRPHLPAATAKLLESEYHDGVCYLWGDRGGEKGRPLWEMMQSGDLALCYQARHIVRSSRIVAKCESLEAGMVAWPDAKSEPYPLIFFLTRPLETSGSVLELSNYFGKVYQGLRRLPTTPRILNEFGTFENFIQSVLLKTPQPRHSRLADDQGDYVPGEADPSLLVERQIRARRGQHTFREALRARFGDRCLVTGCSVVAILEAAHISPFRSEADNHVKNGVLLRADIHTLFDLDLLGIDPWNDQVAVHDSIMHEYGQYHGARVSFPADARPAKVALESRYRQFIGRGRDF